MICYMGTINGTRLYSDYYSDQRVILHVDRDGKVFVEANNGISIKRYMESGKFNIFLKYLKTRGIKVLSL